MSDKNIEGKVTFINHEKKYAIIEYLQNNKKKTVNGSIDEKVQKALRQKNLIKKTHHFLVGDVVSFQIKISERGERMIATNIEFLYNNALDVLINRSFTTNRFIGYLKIVDDKYFVKEIDSYLFFPVPFSPWQILPTETELNEQVDFALENIEKKEKIVASLFNNNYIPEFHTAVKLFKAKTIVAATVTNITAHGIYLDVVSDKIKAKIPVSTKDGHEALAASLKIGDALDVLITHLSKSKIVVTPASEPETQP
ncbi:MAG: hypothetical protein JWQ27_1719 [Ferruginibacter sp.]|nr:hypothetical protein [Ferruginibacter sp.]